MTVSTPGQGVRNWTRDNPNGGGKIASIRERGIHSVMTVTLLNKGAHLDQRGKSTETLSDMDTATVSAGGRLVIPLRLRKAMRLQAGEEVSLSLEGDRLVIQREQPNRARLVPGKFGRPVLVAPKGAPRMTPERISAILADVS